MKSAADHLHQPVTTVLRSDYSALARDLTVQQALEEIRLHGIGEKIVYFYVVGTEGRLEGVLPTRRLLTVPLDRKVAELMITRVVAIPETATILEVLESFVFYKFLAFPVVDAEHRLVGVVDVGLLTDEAFDIAEREQTDALFETMGFHITELRGASAWRAFHFRFPWLLATIVSGLLCALLAASFEVTLAKSIVLAFFLTLVLGLGESVSVQSMTLAIQALRTIQPTWRWYVRAFIREMATAALLGGASALLVGVIVWLWHGTMIIAISISLSIFLALAMACILGLSAPTLLHALRQDPKIAAGPLTLAITDIFTLFLYFGVAWWLL